VSSSSCTVLAWVRTTIVLCSLAGLLVVVFGLLSGKLALGLAVLSEVFFLGMLGWAVFSETL
jgi:hypothetical protein